jgi:hypothetical protein
MKVIGAYTFGVGNIETFTYGVLKIHYDQSCRTYAIEVSNGKLTLKFPESGGLSREQVDIALDLLSELLNSLGYKEESIGVFQGTSRFNLEHPKSRPNASLRRFNNSDARI